MQPSIDLASASARTSLLFGGALQSGAGPLSRLRLPTVLVVRLLSIGLWTAPGATLVFISSSAAAAPSVTLTAPVANTVFTLPRTLTLTATASVTNGSVAKVEFFNGATKLGEGLSPPFQYIWTPTAPGAVSLTARATGSDSLTATSSAVTLRLLPSLPYTADFEPAEGYSTGSIDGQLGWVVPSGNASIGTTGAALGTRSVTLSAQSTATELDHEFGSAPPHPPIVYADLFAKPVAGLDYVAATLLDVDAARVAFVTRGTGGQFAALDGNGLGAGDWRNLGPTVVVNASGATQAWQRITARLNYTTKTWDLYIGAVMIAADLKFRLNTATYFSWLSLKGHTAAAVQLDDVYIAPLNPLFTDFNKNGIIDTWEAAHGMWLGTDNRQADADNDGLKNVQEYVSGTNPIKADTDSDGMPDGWEVLNGLNPHSAVDAVLDTDNDGTTNIHEYLLGRNPTKGILTDINRVINLHVFSPNR